MPAVAITPVGLLVGFAIGVVLIAAASSLLAWRSLRRSGRRRVDRGEEPVIDLAYLERAIKADGDAAARREAARRPLLSQSSDGQPGRHHRLPTDEH